MLTQLRKLPISIQLLSAAAALLSSAAPARLPAEPIPLEKLLSAPFPSQMAPAPVGGRIAWVVNERGVRNLWVAGPPDYQGRRLTSYSADDGQDITTLEWTPDGSQILYVRGGSANGQGEIPNPVSNPAGAEQAIWRISAEGGDPVRIGVGSEPTVSPKGDGIAFLRRGTIFWAPLGGDSKAEPIALV
ncbi:MAG TPA: S9 family peptidase, partial [Thermoanaerobaculia bacterium]|nr:S9 family peptidase [Thermoanaerobaculia bacterium]